MSIIGMVEASSKMSDRFAWMRGASAGRPPQLAMEKLACPPVGERRRRRVVMRPIMPSEGVILTRIAVDGRIGFARKRRFDFRLCGLGNKLVLLGEMHQQGRMEAVDLPKIFLGVTAVVGDRGVDAVARYASQASAQSN